MLLVIGATNAKIEVVTSVAGAIHVHASYVDRNPP